MEQKDQRDFPFRFQYESHNDLSILSIKLDTFDFSIPAQEFLYKSGMLYLGELLQISKSQLMGVSEIDGEVIEDIAQQLSDLNLKLGAMPTRWHLLIRDKYYQTAPEFNAIIVKGLDGLELPINPLFLQSVDLLELSVRSKNCLQRGEIKLIGDLVQIEERTLLRIPACGRNSLSEIKEELSAIGLHLGMKNNYLASIYSTRQI